jgi:hypothetical protein
VWESCYSSTQRRRATSFETAPIHAADDMLYLIAIAIAMAIDHRPSTIKSEFPKDEVVIFWGDDAGGNSAVASQLKTTIGSRC